MRSPALLVALAALLATPTAVQAASYAGGRLTWVKPPSRFTPTAGVVLDTHGDRVTLGFDSEVACGDTELKVEARRTVAFDGSHVSARGRGVTDLVGPDVRFRWSLTADVQGGAGSGILTVHGRWGRKPCDRQPRRPFDLRQNTQPTGPFAAPPGGAAYVGLSRMPIRSRVRGTVVMRVSANGTLVKARWSVSARCVRAKPYVFTNFSPRAVVQRDGRFLKRERFTQRYAHGDVGRFKTSFGGRFRADGASGTLRARLVLFNRRGRRVGRCDTGMRRWSALAA